MKTNVVLNSPDRELFGVKIRQESKTQMLNLSDLQEAYTIARVQNGWNNRGQLQDILSYRENINRIYYMLLNRNIINISLEEYQNKASELGIISYLKQLGVYKTTGARQTKTTWCHIDIWLLAALELNPDFYAIVLVNFLNDNKDFKQYYCGYEDYKHNDLINHKKAWQYFYPEGNGEAKPGFVLHHINPEWRYTDFDRYSQWNIEDLQLMENSEHIKLHKDIGFDYIEEGYNRLEQLVACCELDNELTSAIYKTKIKDVDFIRISVALNKKIFGRHETGIRNTGSKEELQRLGELERNVAFAIKHGFVQDTNSIVKLIEEA